MSGNRSRLVSRSRLNAESTPARGTPSSARSRESEAPAPARRQHELPPYEPPTCALSATAKRNIDKLRTEHNTAKYQKHLKTALALVPDAAASNNERLAARRQEVKAREEKRQKNRVDDENIPQEHIDAEKYLKVFANKVDDLTNRSEKALRELIDLADEASMQDNILTEVEQNIPAPAAQQARRRRGDDEEEEEEAPAADAEILSAVELLKKTKEDYATNYRSKSMKQRYADSNDYKHFKRAVHDAQHPEENPPPVPHAKHWFPAENDSSGSRRRRGNTTDNTNKGVEDSDDEITIESVSTNLKCPITLKYFDEPYKSDICPHIFEKSAIADYCNGGTEFVENGVRGPKKAKCPQSGCDKMLTIGAFYLDTLMARKVKRHLQRLAREEEDDDEGHMPRGTQRNRPEQIGSDDDDEVMDIDEQEEANNRRKARVKREKSRGLSMAPSRAGAGSDDDMEE